MLPYRRHWHIAFERNPEREARLLWNNNATAGQSPEPNDPLQAQEGYAGAGANEDGTLEAADGRSNAEAANTNAKENVANEQSQTRNAVNRTMNNDQDDATNEASEQQRLTANEVYERTNALMEKVPALMQIIRKLVKMLKGLPGSDTEESEVNTLKKGWQAIYDELQSLLGSLNAAQEKATVLKKWADGDIAPSEFLQWLNTERAPEDNNDGSFEDPEVKNAQAIVDSSKDKTSLNVEESIFPDMTTDELWRNYNQTYGESDKISTIRALSDAANIDQELASIDNLIKPLETTLEKEKLEDRARATMEKLLSIQTTSDASGLSFKIDWYSIMDYYNAAKGWYEDWKKALENRGNIRKGKLQNKFARVLNFLPYGDDAEAESIRSLDSSHRTRRNELKESLDNEKPLFTEIFGNGNKFQKALGNGDPDYTMSILEYAADRGWLYTLKEEGYVMDGVRLIDRTDAFPSHWSGSGSNRRIDQWLDNLVGQNQAGYNKEKESNAESVKRKHTDQASFLKELDTYLEQINLGAAHGVMEAMLSRAIDADEDAQISVHFFRALREHPEIQQYLTDSIIQNFSLATAGKATLSMTNLFMDRTHLAREARKKKSATETLNMRQSGNLARAISVAESKILAASPNIDTAELDKAVTQILVGKPVEIGTTVISIWDKDFDFYRSPERNYAMRFTKAEGVKDTEPDYFDNPGTYEPIMTNVTFLTEVFRAESANTWVNNAKARALVGKLLFAYKDLKAKYEHVHFDNPRNNPAERMRLEVGKKITTAMMPSMRNSGSLSEVKLTIGGDESVDFLNNQSIGAIAALEVMGFIDLATMTQHGIGLKERAQDEIDRLLAMPDFPKGGQYADNSTRESNANTSSPPSRRSTNQTPNPSQSA